MQYVETEQDTTLSHTVFPPLDMFFSQKHLTGCQMRQICRSQCEHYAAVSQDTMPAGAYVQQTANPGQYLPGCDLELVPMQTCQQSAVLY